MNLPSYTECIEKGSDKKGSDKKGSDKKGSEKKVEKSIAPLDKCLHGDCKNRVDLRVTKTKDLNYCRIHLPVTSKNDDCLIEGCKKKRTYGYGTQMTPSSELVFIYCFDHAANYHNFLIENMELFQKLDGIFEPKSGPRSIAKFENDNKCYNSRSDMCNVNKFTLIKRRHHCRRCGNSYCKKCCNTFVKLVGYNSQEKLRVCKTCNLENIKEYNDEKNKVYNSLIENNDVVGYGYGNIGYSSFISDISTTSRRF
jgi:hypothetical protein